jgi:hypothetical protein
MHVRGRAVTAWPLASRAPTARSEAYTRTAGTPSEEKKVWQRAQPARLRWAGEMRPRAAAAENDTSIERCMPCDLDEAPVVDGVRGIYPVVGRKGCSRQKTYAGRNGLVRLGAHVESR